MQLNCKTTFVLRHRRENLKKCSLRGLENREDFKFYTYPSRSLPLLTNTILLSLGAPELTLQDQNCNLFLIDATWRYAEVMQRQVLKEQPHLILRSLPATLKTSYPRRQDDCVDPEKGLASIEALYAAYLILGWEASGLLNNYHWRDDFLDINKFFK